MDTSAVLGELASAGVTAWPQTNDSFETDDGRRIFVSSRSRTPTPADIASDLKKVGDARMLYSVSRLTPGLRDAVRQDTRLIVFVSDSHSLWLDGIERRPDKKTAPAPRKGPKPYNRYALERALILDDQARPQAVLAGEIGAPQSAVSQSMRSLKKVFANFSEHKQAPDRRMLWDHFMTEYPGPGGITTYWWHDTPLQEQAHLVGVRTKALVSGDLAARVIAPWRQPEHVTMYLGEGFDPSALGFALGTPSDYTLSITVPADKTIFATAKAFAPMPGYVDPVIAAYDVGVTGTSGDENEAVERIRDQVVRAAAHDG
ncbi:hypothetical protein [Herbiconiux sp. VKM Ac-2851]|uniref:hypothetical protein n=1 Tax=Herbiconiux sp. VKM Ac-2851 TaxID=2739025 RepID=UPI001567C695|nr:hypothetical protein [Herbiconiux sp. VKM Ac-2851]NQX35077.1 hypothetical protein [Herbiconiux sp. VKM Ac-2851]